MMLTMEKKAVKKKMKKKKKKKKKKKNINSRRYCLIISECLSMLIKTFCHLLAISTHPAPPRVS